MSKLLQCGAPTQHYQLKLHLNLGLILPDVASTDEAFDNMTKTKRLHDELSNMNDSMKETIFGWMTLKTEKQKEGFNKCLECIRVPMLSTCIEVYKKKNDSEKWLESGLLWLKYALKNDYLQIAQKRIFWIENAVTYAIFCLTVNNLHQMHYLLRAAKYVLSLPKPQATLESVKQSDICAPVMVKLGFVMFNLRWLSISKTFVDKILLPEGVDEVTMPWKDASELNDVGDMIVRFEELDIPDVDENVFAKSCVEVLLESPDIQRVYAEAKHEFGEAQEMIHKFKLGKELKSIVQSCLEQFQFVQNEYQFQC